MRTALKILCLRACNGLARLFGRTRSPAILMYHSFDEAGWKHGVSPAELKKQIAWVSEHCTVVALADVVAYARGEKELPNNAVAVTIDDGYLDTYEVFFPLAKALRLPFTLFLTTDLAPSAKFGNLKRPSEEQLQEMHASGLMQLGLHGHTHANFPDVLQTGEEAVEIEGSKKYLEATFNQPVEAVAYPAGRVNEAVFAYIQKLQLYVGCTTVPGTVAVGADLLKLPRIGVDRATSLALFKARLGPGFDWYVSVARMVK